MPEQEYCDTIRPVCRQDVTDEEILWAMDDVLDTIPSSRIDMLLELRKDHKVYLLSNIYDRGWQIATEAFRKHGVEPEDCFDKLFLSHEMQLAKPDPRIFHAVIDATGIKPEETIFFDDSRSNIETAKAMGFQAKLAPMNKLEDVLATEAIYF